VGQEGERRLTGASLVRDRDRRLQVDDDPVAAAGGGETDGARAGCQEEAPARTKAEAERAAHGTVPIAGAAATSLAASPQPSSASTRKGRLDASRRRF
jgi:hypothetical protein